MSVENLPSIDEAEIRTRLRGYVLRYCSAGLRPHADDIVQIAWTHLRRAMEADDRNREPGATLIARVAFCATVDEHRKLRRRREVPLDPAIEERCVAPSDPMSAVRGSEIRQAIGECLVAMTDNRSLAVTLYLQGHTGPQTARLLGWTLTKTENLIYRGLADLRRCLAEKGVTP